MEDGLDVVAVRIEQEGAVVAGVVLGPLARGAVRAVAGLEAGSMEGVDGRDVRRREREMDADRRLPLDVREDRAVSRICVRP